MGIQGLHGPVDIAVSGLRAQSLRINVISSNIANSSTSRTDAGTPYRRHDVTLQTAGEGDGGVQIMQVAEDYSRDFKRMYEPGHPDADKDGFVQMPNIDLPVEMMNLVSASRAYEANAAVLKRHQELSDVALELLR